MSQMSEMAKCRTNQWKEECPNVEGAQCRNDLGVADSTTDHQEHSSILPCIGLSGISPFRTFVTFR
ncbi:MAG TPA: hypothetical protein PKW63_07055, partial [Vicinamibacterales bacterium]|nr:hypothetical protein [Vicinamibacterales bacterium]